MKRTLSIAIRLGGASRAVAAGALCAALAGCGSSPPLFTPDGRPTTLVQCPAAGPWDTCRQDARGICQSDFDVIRQTTGKGMNNLFFACKAN